jgi:hypothetical protein
MQLTYRGIQYNYVSAFLADATAHHTATYRGITYSILPSKPVALLSTRLKYRGVSYAQDDVNALEMSYQLTHSAMA